MPAKRKAIPQPLNIRETIAEFKHKETSLWVPDIMEFVLSDQFLGANIYPRQATMLKIAFLQDELFTQYDYDVIGEWTQSFIETEDNGTQPNILERIKICKAEKRPWFKEWINVTGRRGGKGYLGALGGSYVLWNYICKKNPQGYYNIDPNKQLGMVVFGAKKEMARDNLWKDLKNAIVNGPCFAPYISRELGESLTVFAPHDFERMEERRAKGAEFADDSLASFVILPKESTVTAARGLANFCLIFDEMAHVVRQVAKSDAREVYEASTPSLDTFGKDAWLYEPSSPYAKDGKFYENWEQSLRISDGTDGHTAGHIIRPEMFMMQLASWDSYKDYDRANEIQTLPEDIYLHPIKLPPMGFHPGRKHSDYFRLAQRVEEDGSLTLIQPPQLYDDDMKKLEEANYETFSVERLSHWASVMDAYLNPQMVERIFAPWPEGEAALTQQWQGKLGTDYKFHGDPSVSGANFGWAGAHVIYPAGAEFPHVVFDVVSHWEPADFPGHRIDYDVIEDEIQGYIERFSPTEVTFDQGFSNWMISRLQKWVRTRNFPRQINVFQRTATAAVNWEVAETFKTAMGLGLIHAPYDALAKNEMLFLQLVNEKKVDKPAAGPVQTKDVFDAMSLVVHALIGNEIAAFVGRDLGNFRPKGNLAGGLPTQVEQMENAKSTLNALSGWGGGSRGATYSPARGRAGAKSGSRFGRR